MITIIHGEDVVLSRNRFLSSKTETDIILEGKSLELDKVIQAFGSGLFTTPKNVFIENFLSLKKNVSDFEDIVKLIDRYSKETNVFVWEGSELQSSNLHVFKNANIEIFKLPQTLFSFLDGIKPTSRSNIRLFHDALKNSNSELIFYMLIRQFRLLNALSENSSLQIDEVKRLQPWQQQKLQRQMSLFTKEKLKIIYNKLFEIDLKVKTGEITNLTTAIDFFLLEL